MRRTIEQREAPGTTLVTGAAGFIGCHLVERLVVDGWHVRGIDDERTGDWTRIKVPVVRIDRSLELMSPAELREACNGVDVLYHLAAEKHNTPGVTAERTLAVNVSATERLFDAAGSSGVRRIIFTSSLYVYGSLGPAIMLETHLPTPSTVYGVSKLAGEHLLRATERKHGTRWSVVRLFFIYGPRQLAEGGYPSVIVRNFSRIRRGEPPVVHGDGTQALDYVFVDDCVEGIVAIAAPEHHGVTVNLSTGTAVTVNELTEKMLRVSGCELAPVAAPPDWTAGSIRRGSPELASSALGWTASKCLEDGLRCVWDAWS